MLSVSQKNKMNHDHDDKPERVSHAETDEGDIENPRRRRKNRKAQKHKKAQEKFSSWALVLFVVGVLANLAVAGLWLYTKCQTHESSNPARPGAAGAGARPRRPESSNPVPAESGIKWATVKTITLETELSEHGLVHGPTEFTRSDENVAVIIFYNDPNGPKVQYREDVGMYYALDSSNLVSGGEAHVLYVAKDKESGELYWCLHFGYTDKRRWASQGKIPVTAVVGGTNNGGYVRQYAVPYVDGKLPAKTGWKALEPDAQGTMTVEELGPNSDPLALSKVEAAYN